MDPLSLRAQPFNLSTMTNLILALRGRLKKGFQDTRVLEAQPHFFEEILKVPHQIILTHSCVVLGPAGAGKTTLVKALAGAEFQPTVAPGPHMENRSMEAQSCTLQLENLIESENLEVVLIDTPGWSPDTSTNIKSEYKKILKKRGLVSEHTPHIILFCIPVSMIRQFQDAEAKKMSNQLHELKFDQRFPIKVLPVATKADSEHHRDRGQLLFAIKKLAEKAFAGTGADVEDPIYTMFPPEGQPHGVKEVKDCLSAMLSQQINSPEFGGLWQKAFAKSLATHTMRHCEQFPENDSAIRLFQRASRTVAATCGRSVPDVTETTSQDALHLPWESISEAAEATTASASQGVRSYFGATHRCTSTSSAMLALAILPCLFMKKILLLTLFLPLVAFLFYKGIHRFRRGPYSRCMKSTRVHRQVLAVLLVLAVWLSLCDHRIMQEQLSRTASNFKNAKDTAEDMAGRVSASQKRLGMVTNFLKEEKEEADKMTVTVNDKQFFLDVLTLTFENEKEQAPRMAKQTSETAGKINAIQSQLNLMRLRYAALHLKLDAMKTAIILKDGMDFCCREFSNSACLVAESIYNGIDSIGQTLKHGPVFKLDELRTRHADMLDKVKEVKSKLRKKFSIGE